MLEEVNERAEHGDFIAVAVGNDPVAELLAGISHMA
jgi:hypothetical protein